MRDVFFIRTKQGCYDFDAVSLARAFSCKLTYLFLVRLVYEVVKSSTPLPFFFSLLYLQHVTGGLNGIFI